MVEQTKALSKETIAKDLVVKFGALPIASELQKVFALAEKGFDPLLHLGIYQGRITISIDGWWWWARQAPDFDRIVSRPVSKDEKEDYGLEADEIGVIAKLYRKGDNLPHCTGFGKASKRPYTYERGISSKDHPDRMRNPIDAENPYRMAEKRAEAQAIRKYRAVGVDVVSPEEAVQEYVDGQVLSEGEAPGPQGQAEASFGPPFSGSPAREVSTPRTSAGAGPSGAPPTKTTLPAFKDMGGVLAWAYERWHKKDNLVQVCQVLGVQSVILWKGTPTEAAKFLLEAWGPPPPATEELWPEG